MLMYTMLGVGLGLQLVYAFSRLDRVFIINNLIGIGGCATIITLTLVLRRKGRAHGNKKQGKEEGKKDKEGRS